ncbi:hypothetical protein AX15_004412 [Amanita polypyramis BW_CC]|nr:hypothetical protein AX15_004412 [Amanita polypyramis BW_CC]
MFNGYSWQTRILEVRPDRLPPDLDNPLGSVSGPPAAGLASSTGYSLTSFLSSPVHGPNPSSSLHRRSDDFDYGSLLSTPDLLGASGNVGRSLFVGNLPFHCQWQDLKDLFRQAGTIIRADVALGPDGRSRGFGTVIFATEIDAERAMKIFNGYEYNGRILKVHFDRFTQVGQNANYPTSPSLHSLHSTPALTSTALNSLNIAPSIGASYSSQISQAQLHGGYHLDVGLSSRSSPSPEIYQAPVPVLRQQQQLATDISIITGSLGSMHLSSNAVAANTIPLKQSPGSESTSTSASSSASRAPSASSFNMDKSRSKTEKNVSPSGSQHPHHPGPITLPPPAPVAFPSAMHRVLLQNESTPSAQTPVFNSQFIQHQQIAPVTPHGLPPITPSMPPFTFLPPQLSPHQYPSQAHAMMPDTLANQTFPSGLFNPPQQSPLGHPPSPLYSAPYAISGFSPGAAMSPGAVWGRPGNPNPHINPAVGAPVHTPHPTNPGHHVHSVSSLNRLGRRGEPTSYFDLEYFPRDGTHASYISSSLENEIMRDKHPLSPEGDDDDCKTNGASSDDHRSRSLSGSLNGLRNANHDIHERSTGADGQPSTDIDSNGSSTSSNWSPSRE